jgi:hypothetical protein
MTNPKGTIAETALVRYARLHGFPQADRLTKTGAKDRGDVGLAPGVIVEVKNHLSSGKRGPTPAQVDDWMAQTKAETANAGAAVGFLVVKREGTTDVGRWWAFIEAHQLASLIIDGKWEAPSNPGGHYCIPVSLTVGDLLPILRLAGYGSELEEARAACPECRDGKHWNCTGWALDVNDQEVDCQCLCHADG